MYIEQLGEFLQINKRDMASCKPDKAAILNEVVKTVSRMHWRGDWTGSSSSSRRSERDRIVVQQQHRQKRMQMAGLLVESSPGWMAKF